MERKNALVAQRIEQLPSKQWVVGSIPARGTNFSLKIPLKRWQEVAAPVEFFHDTVILLRMQSQTLFAEGMGS